MHVLMVLASREAFPCTFLYLFQSCLKAGHGTWGTAHHLLWALLLQLWVLCVLDVSGTTVGQCLAPLPTTFDQCATTDNTAMINNSLSQLPSKVCV